MQLLTMERSAQRTIAVAESWWWLDVERCGAALNAAACSPALLGCVYFLQTGFSCKGKTLIVYMHTRRRKQSVDTCQKAKGLALVIPIADGSFRAPGGIQDRISEPHGIEASTRSEPLTGRHCTLRLYCSSTHSPQ